MRTIRSALFLAAGLAVFPLAAGAYLDAGSGSYFIQIIIGAVVGGAVALKVYFSKIRTFVTKLFRRNKQDGG